MNLPRDKSHSRQAGYALLTTLCFIGVALVTFAGLINWVSTNAKITRRNNLFNQSQAAAESATEAVLASMMRDFNNQSLNSAGTYASAAYLPVQTNWPINFQFSDTNGNPNSTTVTIDSTFWGPLPSEWSGLYGLGQNTTIASTATPQNVGENLSATVCQNVWFGTIPIFQFAIFYNMDLEINPGAAMTINGRVHSNNNIYATGASSGSPLTFSDYVEAALQYYAKPSPLDPQNVGRSGNVNFSITANNPTANAESMALPIGTNNNPATVIGILGLPPSGVAPTSPAGQSYPYNEADLIVQAAADGTLSVYYQNLNDNVPQTLVPMDVTNINLAAHTTNTYYSFVTNVTFYDYRESDTVKAIQVDVASLDNWLTNSAGGLPYQNLNTTGLGNKGHGINGVYVYNGIATSGGQLPAVRLVNGSRLPSAGLSVATPFPIYIKGDFNTTTNNVNYSTTMGDTTNTLPAAIMGDAVTILSANWSDSYNASTALSSRNPTSTTINAACLEGIVPSNASHYSGGVENFLRLLENWSGSTLTYNGSIVVLFQSQYAVSPWLPTGNYYNAPTRKWGFDLNFKQQDRLPPMTPQVRETIRGNWYTM